MNVLPIIFTFLVIFSILTGHFMQKMNEEKLSSAALKGNWNAQILLDNKLEQALFTLAEGKSPEEKKESGNKKPTGNYRSFRMRDAFAETSKLSLHPLKGKISIQHRVKLEKIFKQLISDLYGSTSLAQELNGLDKLCHEVIAAVNSSKQETLSSLELSYELQPLFYKMCRGTSLGAKGGFPSLENFVTLKEFKKEKSIFFNKASFPVLKASLGEACATDIISAEKEKFLNHQQRHLPLKKEEFFLGVGKDLKNDPTEFFVLESIFSFDATSDHEGIVRVKDPSSKIVREVYTVKTKKISPKPLEKPGQ